MANEDKDEMLGFIVSTVETIRNQMATKADIARLETEIVAVRGDIEQVHLRLDNIEQTL